MAQQFYSPLQLNGTLTVGADDTGHDVKFYGATSGRYLQWDESADALKLKDSTFLYLGNGNDLQLYHNGTNNFIETYAGTLFITQHTNDSDIIFRSDNGSGGVETYFFLDGSEGLNRFYKNVLHQDNVKSLYGTGLDLQIYHNGTDSVIDNLAGDFYISQKAADKDLIFRADDGSGGYTPYLTLDGSTTKVLIHKEVDISSHLSLVDSAALNFGNANDLQIYHDGSHSYISDQGTGVLKILSSGVTFQNPAGSANALILTEGGAATFAGTVTASSYKISSTTVLQGTADVTLGSAGGTGTISLTTHTSTPFKIENDDTISIGSDTTFAGSVISQQTGGGQLHLRRDDTSISGTNTLGSVLFAGDDPTDGTFNDGSAILGKADGSWSSGVYPGRLELQTKTTGTLITALTLDKDQNATFAGTISGNGKFIIANNGTATWGAANDYGQLSWDTGYALIRGQSGKGIKLQTNSSSTALTLDTSQNATFAGTLTIPSYIYHTGDPSTDTYFGFNGNDNFTVVTAGGNGLVIDSNRNATFTGDLTIPGYINHAGDSGTKLGFEGNDAFRLYTASTMQLQIDSSGNTTFAGAVTTGGTVNVNNAGSDKKMSFDRTGGKGMSIEHDSSSIYFYNETDSTILFRMFNAGAATLAGVLTSTGLDINGNADISGTTVCNDTVTIVAGAPKLILKDSTDDDDHQIQFMNNSGGIDYLIRTTDFTSGGGADGLYIGSTSSDEIGLVTNNTTALTLDTSQNATFAGQASAKGVRVTTRGTASAETWNTSDGDGIFFDFYNDGNPYLRHGSIIANSADASAAQLEFYTTPASGSGTLALTLDSSQNATFTGQVNIPDSTELRFGGATDGDFAFQHNGTHNLIKSHTGDLKLINYQDDGDILFFSDDGSGGITEYFRVDGGVARTVFSKDALFSDNVNLAIGDSLDLFFVHNGSHSFITAQGTGNLYIRNINNDKDIIFQSDDGAGGVATYFSLDGSAATHDGSATTALH